MLSSGLSGSKEETNAQRNLQQRGDALNEIDSLQDILTLDNEKILISVLEASSDGILISDNKGNVVYVNKAYEDTTGLKKGQMIGKNLNKLLEQKLFNRAVSLSVLKKKKTVSVIHKYVTGKNALTTASPIYDEEEKIVGVVCNTRSITELVRLRKELIATKKLSKNYLNELQQLRQLQIQCDGLVFKSRIMSEMLQLASKAAAYDSTILIHGESGTGKEVLAKFIHQQSSRKEGPFIKVNCAAIPAELFESELFGYESGSFTGASHEGKLGMFELANDGTILLDEVGELPLPIQSKLLRAIQEREVFRVGGQNAIKFNVRILVATNKNLAEEVKSGRFREDLYFRLNVVPITIPPLRKRKEDISELVSYFLEKLNKRYKKNITIATEVIDIMTNYSWPGNVRELENLIEYLFIFTSSDEIGLERLPTQLLTDHFLADYNNRDKKSKKTLYSLLDKFERNIIVSALKNYPSMRQTAAALGIDPSTLSRKIKKYEINGFLL